MFIRNAENIIMNWQQYGTIDWIIDNCEEPLTKGSFRFKQLMPAFYATVEAGFKLFFEFQKPLNLIVSRPFDN